MTKLELEILACLPKTPLWAKTRDIAVDCLGEPERYKEVPYRLKIEKAIRELAKNVKGYLGKEGIKFRSGGLMVNGKRKYMLIWACLTEDGHRFAKEFLKEKG